MTLLSGFSDGRSDFFVVDASVGWRFPKRLGIASLTVYNLFNEKFFYQDDNFREFRDERHHGPLHPGSAGGGARHTIFLSFIQTLIAPPDKGRRHFSTKFRSYHNFFWVVMHATERSDRTSSVYLSTCLQAERPAPASTAVDIPRRSSWRAIQSAIEFRRRTRDALDLVRLVTPHLLPYRAFRIRLVATNFLYQGVA